MKICPSCKLENPSKAHFCIQCGHSLDEEALPEELQLRKELEDAKSTIRELKDSLASLRQQKDASDYKQHIVDLNGTIAQQEKTIISQKATISKLKSVKPQTEVKKSNWGWWFVALFAIAVIVIFFQAQDSKSNNESLQSELSEVNYRYSRLSNAYPIIIKDIDIAFADKNNKIITDYGDKLYKRKSKYLKPRITYTSDQNKEVKFKVKWYYNGKCISNPKVQGGFTQSYTLSVNEGENTLELLGYGADRYGHWSSGDYRVEIWVGNSCLKSKSFKIH